MTQKNSFTVPEIPEQRRRDYLFRLRQLRLIDDTFMTKVFEDHIPCTEELLRTILNRDDLIVQSVQTQYTIQNLQGRSVRLDIHATDRDGTVYNIEVQRAGGSAGQKRARHNSSMLDANALLPGDDVEQLPETYVIFIAEQDVLEMGNLLYLVERTVNLQPVLFGDGSHIIYVNASCQDDSPLGLLMRDFFCTDPADMTNRILARRVDYLKNNEEGVETMCELMEELWRKGIEEGRLEGRLEGKLEGRLEGKLEGRLEGKLEGRLEGRLEGKQEIVFRMMKRQFSADIISECTGLSVDEVQGLAMQEDGSAFCDRL